MTARDGLIEWMARAEFDRRYGYWWDSVTAESKHPFLEQAKRRLEDIEAHAGGCIVVPLEVPIPPWWGPVMHMDQEERQRAWNEILAASPYAPEKGP